MATFNKILVKAILQKYTQAADYTEREISVAAYQGLKNYQTLIYYTIEA